MATPPGGHPYGSPQQQPQAPLKRFNFPSAPSHRLQPEPAPAPEPAPGPPPHVPQQMQPAPQEPQGVPPEQQMPTPRIQPHIPSRGGSGGPGGRSTPVGSDQQPLVRPYAMTGGRTRPRYQLAIEALVSHHRRPGPDARPVARAPADLPSVP